MKNLKYLLSALLLCTFIQHISAQQGALSGVVYDSAGEILYGANVIIEGTSTGGQTDYIDGKYSFKTDPGTYTILASYIGYPDTRLEGIEVKANETFILDIVLEEEGGIELEEVVVVEKALERSENAVLVLRKKADKVQDIISSQEISRLGASNASSALQKVTGTTIVDGKYVYVRGLGDRYSATTLNGLRLPSIDPYRNSAQLDLIPTSILDNITASKSFTPDLPGDFTGGSVNIKLKSLPERFTWSIGASVAYNEQNNLQDNFLGYANPNTNFLGFQDGSLDLPDALREELPAPRTAERDDEAAAILDKAIRSIPGTMEPVLMESGIDHSFNFSIGNQFELGQAKLGVFATGSYSKDFSQFQNGVNASFFASPGESELIRFFGLDETNSEESPVVNGMLGFSLRPNNANSINAYAIYSHQTFLTGRRLFGDYDDFDVGGDDSFFSSETQAFMERELADFVLSGEHTLTNLNRIRIQWSANYVDSKQIEPDLRFFAFRFLDERFDINESLFTLPTRFWRDLNDDLYQGKLDITIPFLQGISKSNSIKFGGSYSTKSREFNELQWIYRQRDGLNFNELESDADRYFGSDNIGVIGRDTDRDRNIIGLYLIDNVSPANSYTGDTDIAAGYVMTTLEFNKLKVIAGVRGENTDILVNSEVLNIVENPDSLAIAMNRADIEDFSLLPALNLVYSLDESSNLRFSATQTLARPNMREVAPFGAFGAIGEPTIFGNPQLTLTTITNLDLRWEIFPRSGEVFAVSAFYKSFDDPIVSTYRPAGNPQFTWVNVNDAELYGAEVEVRKDLDFLSPKLEDFNISANFAYIESSVSVDERECELSTDVDPNFDCNRQFAGQSPFVANANLGYTNIESGWDAVLAYNFFDDRLASVGAVGTPDIFERGRGQLDLSLSKKIQNLKLTVRARNLLNPDYEEFSEFMGDTYIFRSFRRGVTFSFGASYSM